MGSEDGEGGVGSEDGEGGAALSCFGELPGSRVSASGEVGLGFSSDVGDREVVESAVLFLGIPDSSYATASSAVRILTTRSS